MHSVQTPNSGLKSCSINTLRSSCCCRPTKRGARTTPTPKGHIKESIYGRQRDGHMSRDNQNFPISPKFMLCKIVAIFCDVLMSLVSECSNVYCCSNKYRNTFTADNINILPSFITVWTSGSWCASQISCCQWCLCSVTRSLSLRWQSDPAGAVAGGGGPPHGAGVLLPVATRDVQEVDP